MYNYSNIFVMTLINTLAHRPEAAGVSLLKREESNFIEHYKWLAEDFVVSGLWSRSCIIHRFFGSVKSATFTVSLVAMVTTCDVQNDGHFLKAYSGKGYVFWGFISGLNQVLFVRSTQASSNNFICTFD